MDIERIPGCKTGDDNDDGFVPIRKGGKKDWDNGRNLHENRDQYQWVDTYNPKYYHDKDWAYGVQARLARPALP